MLGDLDIPKSERRRRAEGVKIIGEIFGHVGLEEMKRLRAEEKQRQKEEEEAEEAERTATGDSSCSEGQCESVQHDPSDEQQAKQ